MIDRSQSSDLYLRCLLQLRITIFWLGDISKHQATASTNDVCPVPFPVLAAGAAVPLPLAYGMLP
jgi:hypothetical protein